MSTPLHAALSPSNAQIRIVISGPPACGKSVLAKMIATILTNNAGIPCSIDDGEKNPLSKYASVVIAVKQTKRKRK